MKFNRFLETLCIVLCKSVLYVLRTDRHCLIIRFFLKSKIYFFKSLLQNSKRSQAVIMLSFPYYLWNNYSKNMSNTEITSLPSLSIERCNLRFNLGATYTNSTGRISIYMHRSVLHICTNVWRHITNLNCRYISLFGSKCV